MLFVYEPAYETGGQFWPEVHTRIISCLIFTQVLFIGLFSLKGLSRASLACIPLPILTLLFHAHCRQRFQPTFKNFNLEVDRVYLQTWTLIPKPGFLSLLQRLVHDFGWQWVCRNSFWTSAILCGLFGAGGAEHDEEGYGRWGFWTKGASAKWNSNSIFTPSSTWRHFGCWA